MIPNTFPVRLPIKLGQFVKLANLVEDGATARLAIQGGAVEVNGQVETKRGRSLVDQDVVTITYSDDSRETCQVVSL